MENFRKEIKSVLILHFFEKNFVCFIKRMTVLIAVMLIFEFASKYCNYPILLMLAIVSMFLICFFLYYWKLFDLLCKRDQRSHKRNYFHD